MLFLNQLSQESLESDKWEDAETLLNAMKSTVRTLVKIVEKNKAPGLSLLNFAVSDGRTTIVSRFVHSYENKGQKLNAASLYFRLLKLTFCMCVFVCV